MIEWKEGAVCYFDGDFWLANKNESLPTEFGDIHEIESALEFDDFQLNEPTNGWYIPKSELDTEEKYNKAVEVFGLFWFYVSSISGGFKSLEMDFTSLTACNNVLVNSNFKEKTKVTFNQLMAIGELKRKMDEPKFGKNEDGSMKLLKSNFSQNTNSSEQVKNPSHYQLMDGIESIEIIARSMTQEQWKGFCLGNMLKYRIRAGKKDKLQQDIDKANFYGELYEMHKGKCYE